MPKKAKELTHLAVSKIKEQGLHAVGGVTGLYLQVTGVARSWILRYRQAGKDRYMGLGSFDIVTLAQARSAAMDAKKMIAAGNDPVADRRRKHLDERLARAKDMTFMGCAAAYIDAHRAGWRSEKHANQWRSTIATYAAPAFGNLAVSDVDTTLVLRCLEPIWTTKSETASRLRGRIESVLDWATVRGYRQGDNPARWRGHLDKLLPKPSKVQTVIHHPAIPWRDIGGFMEVLRNQSGVSALALEFLILTASRTGEVIGARLLEFDLPGRVWVIPGVRMKSGKDHRVPLSHRAIEIIESVSKLGESEWVFPGVVAGKPISNMALLMLLRRMGRKDLTAHGFRSSFRDWCAEATNYPREVAEMALSHSIGNEVEAAYRRGDLLEKRSRLMDDWAKFCAMPSTKGEVIPIRKLVV